MPSLSVMIKPASGQCNMACSYCFYCDEAKKREQGSFGMMSEQTLRNVIRKTMLNAEGSITYAFQGGEPSLRGLDFFQKVIEFEQKYNHNGIRVFNAFQTNGLLLDEAWCRFFAEHGFLVGLSLDGTKATHDRFRKDLGNQPTYDRVAQAAALMDRFGVEYNILTVVNSEVATHIDEIYADYKQRGWRYQQYIACLDPLEEERGLNPWSLTPEVYGRFLSRLFDLWYEDWKQGQQPYIRSFENYIAILLGYQPESCEQNGRCTAQCVVEADGSVYPCDFYVLEQWKLGNFNTDRFDAIHRSDKIGAFVERSYELDPKCPDCEFYKLCRGGCQRQRDHKPQGFYANYFCEAYRIFFRRSMTRMLKIAESLKGI